MNVSNKNVVKNISKELGIDEFSTYKIFNNIYFKTQDKKEIFNHPDFNFQVNRSLKIWLLYLLQKFKLNKKNKKIQLIQLLGLKKSWNFLSEIELESTASIIIRKWNFIILIYSNPNKFVIKSAKTSIGNNRLKNEIESLIIAKQIQHSIIKIPAVLDKNIKGEFYYFKEEFVEGQILSDKKKVKYIFENVFGFMSDFYFLNNINLVTIPEEFTLLDHKVQTLIKDNNNAQSVINYFLELYNQKLHLLKSRIHGDLSIHNVLVNENIIYLIDWEKSKEDYIMIDLKNSQYDTQPVFENIISRLNNTTKNQIYPYHQQLFVVLFIELVRLTQNGISKNLINDKYKAMITNRINRLHKLLLQIRPTI